jgi:predicted amidohydrolase
MYRQDGLGAPGASNAAEVYLGPRVPVPKFVLEASMVKIAAVQMQTELMEPEANLASVISRLHEAALMGAKVAVFPECTLTGYSLTAEEALDVAESIPGPRLTKLTAACQAEDVLAVVGTLEADEEGRIFNSAMLVGPEGLLGRYRKTHLPFLGVDRYLAAGGAIPGPFTSPVGKLGLLICYDLRFPEPIRALALSGAQAVLLPTAWPASATLYPEFMAQSRSAENSLFLVAANRCGEERGTRYLGRSIISGPNGEVLAEAGPTDDEILCADLDLTRSDAKRRVFVPGEYELDLFGDRRPELYGALVADSALE